MNTLAATKAKIANGSQISHSVLKINEMGLDIMKFYNYCDLSTVFIAYFAIEMVAKTLKT
jgi:hypothetical protein